MADDGDRFRHWLETNQGVAAVLTALLGLYLVYLAFSPWVYRPLRDGFTLGFFPMVAVAAMILCTAAVTVDGRRHEVADGVRAARWRDIFHAVALLALSYLWFEGMDRIGFLLVTPPVLYAFMYVLGMRPWRSAALSAGVLTLAVYGFFRIIGIALPNGILPEI